MRTLQGHEGDVLCLLLSQDGTQVISGSTDSTIKFWNLDSGECDSEYDS